jgi:hypothetical protein
MVLSTCWVKRARCACDELRTATAGLGRFQALLYFAVATLREPVRLLLSMNTLEATIGAPHEIAASWCVLRLKRHENAQRHRDNFVTV